MTTKRIPYALWTVNGREYKLKLSTADIVDLEKELKTNLLNVMMSGNIPSLAIMLKITHKAMLKFEHGIKERDVYELFDTYLDEGGSQTLFMTEVFMPIYQASGFISEVMEEEMNEQMNQVKNKL